MASSSQNLTMADTQALAELPEGWFEAGALPINRPLFRCQRLEAAGRLESRVELDGLQARQYYRRVDTTGKEAN